MLQPDEAHRITDLHLEDIEKRLRKEYTKAAAELDVKLSDYLRRFRKKDEIKRKQYLAKEITLKEYVDWRKGQMLIGQRWQDTRDTIAADLRNEDKIARSIVDGYMPEVYALNHNYATFRVERESLVDTSYSLYTREAVERMMREDPDLLPPPGKRVNAAIAEGKAVRWQKQQVQSVMMQGILQGKGIPELARDVSRELGERNLGNSIRYARTMATGAENAGREDAYDRAESKGILLTRQWLATLDHRTRTSHRHLHGEIKTGEKYSNGCRYPGDPSGPGEEVWNCRCSEVAWVKGLERETVKTSPKLGDMTFEDWLEEKPVYNPIKLPVEKQETIKAAHIANYRKAAARLK